MGEGGLTKVYIMRARMAPFMNPGHSVKMRSQSVILKSARDNFQPLSKSIRTLIFLPRNLIDGALLCLCIQ